MEQRQTMPRHRLQVEEFEEPAVQTKQTIRTSLPRFFTFMLLGGVLLTAAAIIGPHAMSIAQQPAQPQPARSNTAAQSAQAPQAKPAPQRTSALPAQRETAPVRTETTQYDSWTVICQESLEKAGKRSCAALSRVVEPKSNQVVFVWRLDFDPDGKMIARMQTPTGVRLQSGVEVKLGKADTRRFMFTLCDAKSCLAEAIVEDGLLKEAVSAPEGTALVRLRDGRGLQFKWSMKGFDKAIASLRTQR